MKLIFNDTVKLAGIGMVPLPRLGPEKWFKEYKIASLYDWDIQSGPGVPYVLSLSNNGIIPELKKINTAEILKNKKFQDIIEQELPGYSFLTYKPVSIPKPLQHRNFLMVNKDIAEKFENKVYFRQQFADKIALPEFTVYDRANIATTQAQYETLMQGRATVVLQDEQLSGGKGTFIVSSFDDFAVAMHTLATTSKHEQIIVSTLVQDARERSIQACVTKHGIFTGPLQRQIVRHPLLASDIAGAGDKFCGAQILADDQDTDVHKEAERVARLVGAQLQAEGYQGIFGIDFLLGADDVLYAIETNPRITGVTPLLTALFEAEEGVPFYALHLLELAGIAYDIHTDGDASVRRDGAMLLMHSLSHLDFIMEDHPQSGTYALQDGALQWVSDNIQLTALKPGEWVVQAYTPRGARVRPGGRTMVLETNTSVIDKTTDMLYDETTEMIKAVQAAITTRHA